MGELDQTEIRRSTMTDAELEVEATIYGVSVSALAATTGPSVVSLNGAVAPLAVTEFMKFVTGLLAPATMLRYIATAAASAASSTAGRRAVPVLPGLGSGALRSAARVTLENSADPSPRAPCPRLGASRTTRSETRCP